MNYGQHRNKRTVIGKHIHEGLEARAILSHRANWRVAVTYKNTACLFMHNNYYCVSRRATKDRLHIDTRMWHNNANCYRGKTALRNEATVQGGDREQQPWQAHKTVSYVRDKLTFRSSILWQAKYQNTFSDAANIWSEYNIWT